MASSVATLPREAGVELTYTIDDFHDPWRPAETIVLVHGLAESGEAFYGWVPHLGRTFRIVRPDLRGFGRSTPMSKDFAWSLDGLADDIAAVIEGPGGGRVHVVGAKIGSTICTRLATRHPHLLRTLTLIGLPVKGSRQRPGLDPATHGVRAWARSSMEERMGHGAPEMLEWWSDLMGATALSTLLGFSHAVGDFDVSKDLRAIQCPTLLLTTDSPRHPAADTHKWCSVIPNAEAAVVPGEGYHAAAVYPDACAKLVLDFIAHCQSRQAEP